MDLSSTADSTGIEATGGVLKLIEDIFVCFVAQVLIGNVCFHFLVGTAGACRPNGCSNGVVQVVQVIGNVGFVLDCLVGLSPVT
mgnify:CR=1 FL=1